MKVIVIGLGSMGKRRIRLLHKLDKNLSIVGVDICRERREACAAEYNVNTWASLDDLPKTEKANCAFVCTSPLSHSKIINQCLKNGMHVFSELNLVTDGYDENISLAKNRKLTLFMSSTFLYRDEILYIKTMTEKASSTLNYIYHVGQYLPDWHPWENYTEFFVGDKRSNGCREIFAIELPWLSDVFGEIKKITVNKSKMTSLDVDYQDNFLLLIEHSRGHKGMLAVDIVSRKAVRNLEVFGEQLYVHWDGSPEGLYVYDYDKKQDKKVELIQEVDHLDTYSKFVVENAYSNEIAAFFDAVINGKAPSYTFEKDKAILKIIDEIEA